MRADKYGDILLIMVLVLTWSASAQAATDAEVWTKGSVAAVQNLINRTGDLNAPDSEGDTPLILASKFNSSEVIELLITRGADPNLAKPPDMYTPLMFAAIYNPEQEKTLKALVANGADINAQDKNGKTALIHAAAYNDHNNVSKNRGQAVVTLLQLRTDPFIRDKDRLTANHYGQKNLVLSNSRARDLLAQYSDQADSPYYAANQSGQTKSVKTDPPVTEGTANEEVKNDAGKQPDQRTEQPAGSKSGINITIISGGQHNISNLNGQQTVTNVGGDQINASESQVINGGIQTVEGDISNEVDKKEVDVNIGDRDYVENKSTSFFLTVSVPAALIMLLIMFCRRYISNRKKR